MCFLGCLKRFFLKRKICVGRLDVIRRDYNFVIPDVDVGSDIFIRDNNLNYALDGDIVEVEYSTKRNKDWKYVGFIRRILKRNTTVVYGTLSKNISEYSLNITSLKFFGDIDLIDIENINCNLFPSLVEAEIIKYPSKKNNLLCRIKNIYGPLGNDNAELVLIQKKYKIDDAFPKEALDAANNLYSLKISKGDLKGREDFRNEFTFTIDPKDSRDFDDALSIVKLDNSNFKIGIHIADVSHYIKEGDLLDKVAYSRNTSVYFLNKVVPMLPEIICNNICSLLPNEDRLTFSVVVEIDKDYNVVNTDIVQSIIHSNLRLTYDDAQDILDNNESVYHDELSILMSFAKKLKQARIDDGALNINFSNIEYCVNKYGDITAVSNDYSDSHIVVEELMIFANRSVAEFVFNKKNKENKSPVFIYRVHKQPEKWRIIELAKFLSGFDIFLNYDSDNIEGDINKILSDVRGTDIENIISMLVVRTMQRAIYSTNPIGHYGLALKYYSHFTSPIRRYNDIIVHRLLKKYLNKNYEYNPVEYDKKCEYLSEKEKNANEAEREYLKYKQVKYLLDCEGDVVDGVITGLTDWGIFVDILDIKCNGLIRFSNVENDLLIFDNDNKYVYGKFTGNIYRIGDLLKVVVLKCNLELKTVDLTFF